MPGRNGTGPMGAGPGTGGGWGPCGQGRGWSVWGGRRWGGAQGGVGGHGWRNRFWSRGWSRWFHPGSQWEDVPTRMDERQLLEREAEALKVELSDIKRRLERLDQPAPDGS
jgi:hypothetical protein